MNNRRAIQLAKRVEKWQSLLAPLGIGHFHIDSISAVEHYPGPGNNMGALASVRPSTNYDHASFEFHNDFVDDGYDSGDFRALDTTIIHEWLHVVFKTLDNAVALAEAHLAPAVEEMWTAAIEHAEEQLIDRLAQQLYDDLKDYI